MRTAARIAASLGWLLVEPVTDEGEQLGGFKDHVIDEIYEREDDKQDRDATRDLKYQRRSRELAAPGARAVANGEGEGGGDASCWHAVWNSDVALLVISGAMRSIEL